MIGGGGGGGGGWGGVMDVGGGDDRLESRGWGILTNSTVGASVPSSTLTLVCRDLVVTCSTVLAWSRRAFINVCKYKAILDMSRDARKTVFGVSDQS